jgi:hypothetical protein
MKRLARSALGRLEDALSVDVVPRRYWSPIPRPLPEDAWQTPSPLHGIDWDLDAQAEFVRGLEPLMRDDVGGAWFGGADARVLYAMVRSRKPRLVVELGSGTSTQIIGQAIHADGLATEHLCFDPNPGFTPGSVNGAHVEPLAAQQVPEAVFGRLAAGDILFVDTTHTVKMGGDVNRIMLDILPTLAPGVAVHIHDIFLPYEYPREWVSEKRLYWAEQYLVQAFLIGNRDWRTLAALHALARRGLLASDGAPGSLWLERVGA